MKAKARLRARGQITLPPGIREAAHLEEGDPVTFELVPDGILLRPQKEIDSTQAWFWAPGWQQGEREASADIESGRMRAFDDAESFLRSLGAGDETAQVASE